MTVAITWSLLIDSLRALTYESRTTLDLTAVISRKQSGHIQKKSYLYGTCLLCGEKNILQKNLTCNEKNPGCETEAKKKQALLGQYSNPVQKKILVF